MWNNREYARLACIIGISDVKNMSNICIFICVNPHVKFYMFHMWHCTCEIPDENHKQNFTCEISHVSYMWNFTCESYMKFHIWITCEISHVKIHMWNLTCEKQSHVKLHMWLFTCHTSHVKLISIAHVFYMRKQSHVKRMGFEIRLCGFGTSRVWNTDDPHEKFL